MLEPELISAILKSGPIGVAILAAGFSLWKWILPMLRELRQMDRDAEAQREAAQRAAEAQRETAQRESEAAREAARAARDRAAIASRGSTRRRGISGSGAAGSGCGSVRECISAGAAGSTPSAKPLEACRSRNCASRSAAGSTTTGAGEG